MTGTLERSLLGNIVRLASGNVAPFAARPQKSAVTTRPPASAKSRRMWDPKDASRPPS
jgi:hypothetical protein